MAGSRAVGSGGIVRFVLGPWPLYPGVILLMTFGLLAMRAFGRAAALSSDAGHALAIAAPNLVTAGVVAASIAGMLWAAPRALARTGRTTSTRPSYLATVGLAGVALTATITLMSRVVFPDPGDVPSPIVSTSLITLVLGTLVLLVLNGAIGRVDARLRRSERLLAERLAEVERQRSAILATDERIRREIASSLHDDVQTRLLRAAIRLGTIEASVAEDRRAVLAEAIGDIEDVREHGVRALGRRLAPNLGVTGLPTALRERAEVYAGVMEVAFDFADGATEGLEEPVVPLAAYRIVEQALQNALKHGAATRAIVRLERVEGGQLRVEVIADGASPPGDPEPGDGMRIIDSWIATAGGRWTLEAAPDGGSRVVAVIGRPGSQPR